MPSRERIFSKDPEVTRASNTQDRAFDSLIKDVPFLEGKLLEGIVMPASEGKKHIAHGLGRKWRGFIVTKNRKNAQVWFNESEDETKKIILKASAATTISIWIF